MLCTALPVAIIIHDQLWLSLDSVLRPAKLFLGCLPRATVDGGQREGQAGVRGSFRLESLCGGDALPAHATQNLMSAPTTLAHFSSYHHRNERAVRSDSEVNVISVMVAS